MDLILHIGTPKTGTSSLQQFLFVNHAALKTAGVLYPKSVLGPPHDPKYQPVFSCIYAGNAPALDECLGRIADEADAGCGSVILSSEGFYHLMPDYTERSWDLIRMLAGRYRTQVVVYLRPQAEYLDSVYRQYLKNPRGINPEYGSSMTITELLGHPRIAQNLDYYGSLKRWAGAVGERNIVVRRYTKNVVGDFLAWLKVHADGLVKPPDRNPSLTRTFAEVLRRMNDRLDNDARNRLIDRMETYLLNRPRWRDQPFLSPAERRALAARCKPDNDLVARTWLNDAELFTADAAQDDAAWTPIELDQQALRSLVEEIMAT